MAEFRRELDAGYYAIVTEGEGHARAGRRAAARRRARDPAPPDRGRVSTGRSLPETAGRLLAAAASTRGALAAAGALWTLTTVAHTVPFMRRGGPAVRARAAVAPGRLDRCSCTRGRSPSSTPGAARTCVGRKPRADDAARSRRRSACSATSSATTRASCTPAPGSCSSAAARRLARRRGRRGARAPGGRRVFCWCVRVPEPALPSADRIAHLLLALRDGRGGLRHRRQPRLQRRAWRLRRRLRRAADAACARRRAALDHGSSRDDAEHSVNGPCAIGPRRPDDSCPCTSAAARLRSAGSSSCRLAPCPAARRPVSAASASPGCASTAARPPPPLHACTPRRAAVEPPVARPRTEPSPPLVRGRARYA